LVGSIGLPTLSAFWQPAFAQITQYQPGKTIQIIQGFVDTGGAGRAWDFWNWTFTSVSIPGGGISCPPGLTTTIDFKPVGLQILKGF
jgi:hypothetical protein